MVAAKKGSIARTSNKATSSKASQTKGKSGAQQQRSPKSKTTNQSSPKCQQGIFRGRRSWWLGMGFVMALLLFWGGAYVAEQVQLHFQSPIAITWTKNTEDNKNSRKKNTNNNQERSKKTVKAKNKDSRLSSESKASLTQGHGPKRPSATTEGVSQEGFAREGVKRASLFYYLPRSGNPESFRLASLDQSFSQPVGYLQLFRRLLQGPDKSFRERGYVSALPQDLRFLGLDYSSEQGLMRLNVSRHIEQGGGKLVYMRLQQLVFTAIKLSGVRRVELLVEGQRRSHLSGDGIVIPRYLDKEFFRGRDILADSG